VVVDLSDDQPVLLKNGAAECATGSRLLFADVATLLHDPRTLETLYTLGLDEDTASAGCLIVREETFKKGSEVRFHTGGVFPNHVSLLGAPQLIFSEPYTLSAFPAASYPVVANSFLLALVNAAVWRSLGGMSPSAHQRPDLDFCARALVAGFRHLCTAAVSATCMRPGAQENFVDPLALVRTPPQRWQELLSRVTLLHEIGA
jgi:hypothetical protein